MSLIATAPTTAPEASPPATVIQNEDWYPAIDMAHARESVRLDGTVTDARLRRALVDAMCSTNDELHAWQCLQAPAATLADVPAPVIDGESVKVSRYRTAVYSLARADLVEKYRSFDSTKSGHDAAGQLDTTIDEDRRNAHWAICDILGRPRMTVELI